MAPPTSSAAGIIINHEVTITDAAATSKNLTVNAGKSLILNHNFTMAGTNIINGTLSRTNNTNNTFTNSGALSFGATGTYVHAINGGAIVTTTWDPASTTKVTGMSTTAPSVASFSQTFGNFIWNSTGQADYVNFDNSAKNFKTIGLFSILSTGSGNYTFCLSRNLTVDNWFSFGSLLVSGTAKLQLTSSNNETYLTSQAILMY